MHCAFVHDANLVVHPLGGRVCGVSAGPGRRPGRSYPRSRSGPGQANASGKGRRWSSVQGVQDKLGDVGPAEVEGDVVGHGGRHVTVLSPAGGVFLEAQRRRPSEEY